MKWTTRTSCLLTIITFVLHVTTSFGDKCEPWERVELTNIERMTNSTIWDRDNELLYSPDAYWDERSDNLRKVYGCPCKLGKPCMRKCCQKDEAMNFKELFCTPYNASWPWFEPHVPSDDRGVFRTEGKTYFGLAIGNYCRGYLLEPDLYPKEDQFYINFTDGTLTVISKNKAGLGVDSYCLEYLPETDSYQPYVCFTQLVTTDVVKDLCKRLPYTLLPVGMVTSIVFLLISLTVFFLIPKMRNLQGKCLMCQMLILIITYVSLTVVQLYGKQLSETYCMTLGFVIYFSFLSSFFWLNIICFDICSTFSSKLPKKQKFQREERKTFLLYIIYALGIPFIITGIVAEIELDLRIPHTIYKPVFKKTCWIYSETSKMLYFIAPVGFIILCNLLMFIITAFNIWRSEKEIQRLNISDSRRHDRKDDKIRFYLYIKLFILMGLTWIMEIISVIVGGSACIWIVTDLFNTLQGVFIFLIFVCKKKVKKQLMQKLRDHEESSSRVDSK